MKKNKKVLLIIVFSLLGAGAIAALVCHFFMPISTRLFFENLWDILNKPLPIIGISTLMLLVFAWNVFKTSSFGQKKINEFKRETEEIKQEFEEFKIETQKTIDELINHIEELEDENKELSELLKEALKLIPNKKVKALGDKFYGGKEKVNNKTKAN